MAKTKQRLKQRNPVVAEAVESSSPRSDAPVWAIWCRRLAAAMLGGLVVYVAYYPSDSVLVESGDALWFCALSLIVWTLTMSTEPFVCEHRPPGAGKDPRSISVLIGNGLILDVLVWGLAVWMMVAALASCPPGNLRQATNEAWVWIAAAAVLTAARRLLAAIPNRAVLFSLLCAVATGMAVHALHEEWISLPQTRAEYLADPDAMLRTAEIDAPRGSAQRMVFANRLLDGGPTATFALANSLAAMLLVAVLVPVGLLRAGLRGAGVLRDGVRGDGVRGDGVRGDGVRGDGRDSDRAGVIARPGWISASLVIMSLVGVAALFATRSRSALLACLLAVLWIWIRGGRSAEVKRFKQLAGAALIAILISAAVLIALLVFGDEEWMTAAPASLEFRLQYWKATAQLLLDHPLLGAGPGGFQSMYLQYRLPVANESIADPHNFLFETLAAGGFIGGLLLGLTAVACVMTCRHVTTDGRADALAGELAGELTGETHVVSRWMVIGALLSLGLVWSFALLSGQMPDFHASLIAVPTAIAAGWLTHRSLRSASTRQLQLVGSSILLAMMTHLTVSGGWTVPGVAVVIWLTVASLCNVGGVGDVGGDESGAGAVGEDSVGEDAETKRRGKSSLVALCVGLVLLLCIRFESIIPVQDSQLALLRAEDAARRGMLSRVESESRRAVEADDWGFGAPRWRSEFLKSRLIELQNDPSVRLQWQESLQVSLDRAGVNPTLYRAVGKQYLHLYQCFGQREDLESADRLISQALANNPTDLSLVAQAAMIAAERSELARAGVLATEARRLSKLGGNVVRDLGLQQILVVEKIGLPARRQPVSASIKDRFRQRLGPADEPDSDPSRNNETSK